jgi:hypothetical protein
MVEKEVVCGGSFIRNSYDNGCEISTCLVVDETILKLRVVRKLLARTQANLLLPI